MTTDQQKVETPASPMTAQEFIEKVGVLIEQARGAGLSPMQLLLGIYLKQGQSFLGRALTAVENGDLLTGKK